VTTAAPFRQQRAASIFTSVAPLLRAYISAAVTQYFATLYRSTDMTFDAIALLPSRTPDAEASNIAEIRRPLMASPLRAYGAFVPAQAREAENNAQPFRDHHGRAA
jgi:hypothetical protein